MPLPAPPATSVWWIEELCGAARIADGFAHASASGLTHVPRPSMRKAMTALAIKPHGSRSDPRSRVPFKSLIVDTQIVLSWEQGSHGLRPEVCELLHSL